MRLLHTSDWHLGRGLHGADLHPAQVATLGRIVQIARDNEVDAVVIAGDVYDRSVPPVESVRLLDQTLAELCQFTTVIITPGNHDSAARLGFAAALFADRLIIRNDIARVAQPVLLHDDAGEVAVYAFPYLDPEGARRELPGPAKPPDRSHEAVMSRAMDLVRADLVDRGNPRSVVVAHAFVVGGRGRESEQTSESERDITVGTLDNLPATVFAGVNYVALGHLHGQQTLAAGEVDTVLRYSGSPLRFSFSEAGHDKGVTIVDIDRSGAVHTKHISLCQPRGMVKLRGRFEELTDPRGKFSAHRDDWVAITVTDQGRPNDMVARLRSMFAHALVLRHEPDGQAQLPSRGLGAQLADTPKQVLAAFVEDVGGVPPTEQELDVLQRVIAEAFGEGADSCASTGSACAA